jgi:hypothetical protein
MKIFIQEINLAGITFTAGQALKLEKTYDVKLRAKGSEIMLKIAIVKKENDNYNAVFRTLSNTQITALKMIVQNAKPEAISLEFSESKGEK